jgi:hypothetical protein
MPALIGRDDSMVPAARTYLTQAHFVCHCRSGTRQKEGSILVVFVHDQPTPPAQFVTRLQDKKTRQKSGRS